MQGRVVSSIEEDWLSELRMRRQIRKAPRTELASVDENTLVRITGTVQPLENRLLEAPVSSRPCVYYSLTVTWRRSFRLDILLGSENDRITFLLDDGTATAVIDPAHAQTSVVFDAKRERKADGGQHPLFERWWIPHDQVRTGHLVYREAIIEPGSKLSVLGGGVGEPDPGPPARLYRHSHPQRLRFTGTEKSPLLITNDPKTL